MNGPTVFRGSTLAAAICLALTQLPLLASAAEPTTLDTVEVTTSKLPIALRDVAANVAIVTGDELRARGANDLRTALSLVAGVDIAPGGDGGPASSVPALWGLREFDAFLLVVDGTPSGGAFTPALATLNLANVERIEVLKGAAPVSYGATSFVGVIHVIHYAAGQGPAIVDFGFGSRGSARASVALPLSDSNAGWQQSLLADAEQQGLAADRSGWDRAHLLYRGAADLGAGKFTADVDFTQLHQDPVSPHPREGGVLTSRVPLDANHNPRGAEQDEDRGQIALGYIAMTGLGEWSTRLAIARSNGSTIRGFLREDFEDDGVTPNADGYQQDVHRTELYFDSHFATELGEHSNLVWGVDHLYGKGDQTSNNFEYAVLPDGSNAPRYQTLHIDESTRLDDKRNFTGIYADLGFHLTDAWNVQAGLRYNRTRETRSGLEIDRTGPTPEIANEGSDRRNENRLSGAIGTSYQLWQQGSDGVAIYANYRDAFKPAVVDFGPEAEFDILKSESAHSSELGLKGSQMDGRFEWDLSVFRMDFKNLVVGQSVNGLPVLVNAGNERFDGAEAEARFNLVDNLGVVGTYAYHDARFQDYVQDFDGNLTQLRGNLLELSPQHVGSVGLVLSPAQGFSAHATAGFVGKRYLNKRNTSTADSYTTIDAGIGYTFDRWQLRLDGYNLSDRRDPVAESELGDAQYYRLQARSYWLSVNYRFDAQQ